MIVALSSFQRVKINAPTVALTTSVLGRIVSWLKENDPTWRRISREFQFDEIAKRKVFAWTVPILQFPTGQNVLRVRLKVKLRALVLGSLAKVPLNGGDVLVCAERAESLLGVVSGTVKSAQTILGKRRDEESLNATNRGYVYVVGIALGLPSRIGETASKMTDIAWNALKRVGHVKNDEKRDIPRSGSARSVGAIFGKATPSDVVDVPISPRRVFKPLNSVFMTTTVASVLVADSPIPTFFLLIIKIMMDGKSVVRAMAAINTQELSTKGSRLHTKFFVITAIWRKLITAACVPIHSRRMLA